MATSAAAPDQRIAQDALSLAEDASAVRQGKCELLSNLNAAHPWEHQPVAEGRLHDSSAYGSHERRSADAVLAQP